MKKDEKVKSRKKCLRELSQWKVGNWQIRCFQTDEVNTAIEIYFLKPSLEPAE